MTSKVDAEEYLEVTSNAKNWYLLQNTQLTNCRFESVIFDIIEIELKDSDFE